MMLKIKKNQTKLLGIIICGFLVSLSYFGLSYYSIPEKANALVWFPAAPGPGLKDITNMQEMTSDICRDSEVGDSNTLTDTRDNSKYTVARLADGKCWMTQNLRITRESIKAKTSTNTTGLITSADSNVAANYSIPASITTGFSNTTDGNGFYTNQQVRAAANNTYGAYYSYNVATANTVASMASGSAAYDICPKGWHLPSGGENGDYYHLYHYGNSKVDAGYYLGDDSGKALFPAAGLVNASGIYADGSAGYYWTRTVKEITGAHTLYFASSTIRPTNSNSRLYGSNIRCIAYATEDTHASSTTGDITVLVAKMLTLDATTNMTKTVDITEVATGEITATVSANSTYQVLLSAEEPNLVAANDTNDAVIEASADVRAGVTNAWGILNHDGTTYAAVTTNHEQYHDEEENLGGGSIRHIYKIGISISPTLPADTYSTSVTITVAAI